jgi:two-component system response regulator AtoC
MEQFMIHRWPGNVRELENVIERAIILAPGNVLEMADLPPDIKAARFPTGGLTREGISSIKVATRMIEKTLIERALAKTGGNKSQAARMLEISRPILLAKIKEYELGQPS